MRVTATLAGPFHTGLRPPSRSRRPAPPPRSAAAIRAARLFGWRVPAARLSGRDLRLVLAELGACTRLECPDDMFPDPGDEAAVQRAVAMCRRCPVRGYCGERARRTASTYGVWAGRLLDGEPINHDHDGDAGHDPGDGFDQEEGKEVAAR